MQQLATFLNSEHLAAVADICFPDSELQAMQHTLSQFNDEELTQTLSYADLVLENGYAEFADIKKQLENASANRSGGVELATVAEFLLIIREHLGTVAFLVLFARVLGDNTLEIGKFKYQGKSVLPSVSGLFKQKNAK